jgi:hypothetical protein
MVFTTITLFSCANLKLYLLLSTAELEGTPVLVEMLV